MKEIHKNSPTDVSMSADIRRAKTYQQTIIRKSGSCADRPEIMAIWDYNANAISPESIPCTSRFRLQWVCPECGNTWMSPVYSRLGKVAHCPICERRAAVIRRDARKVVGGRIVGTRSFRDANPLLSEWWLYPDNGEMTPDNTSYKSHKDVSLQCPNGHIFRRPVGCLSFTCHCPECSPNLHSSFIEMAIAFYLRKCTKVEQWNMVGGTRQSMDIYLPEFNVCIEYDGVLYHKKHRQRIRDARKDELLKKRGIRMIRIKEWNSRNKNAECIVWKYDISKLQKLMDELCDKLSIIHICVDLAKDGAYIYKQIHPHRVKNSMSEVSPELVSYWDVDGNCGLSPDQVNAYTTKIFSWKCPVCGNMWKHSPIGMKRRKNLCQVCNPYDHHKGKYRDSKS